MSGSETSTSSSHQQRRRIRTVSSILCFVSYEIFIKCKTQENEKNVRRLTIQLKNAAQVRGYHFARRSPHVQKLISIR